VLQFRDVVRNIAVIDLIIAFLSLIFSVDTKGIIISTIIILGAIVGFHGGRALQKEAIYLYLVVCIFHVISLVSQF